MTEKHLIMFLVGFFLKEFKDLGMEFAKFMVKKLFVKHHVLEAKTPILDHLIEELQSLRKR